MIARPRSQVVVRGGRRFLVSSWEHPSGAVYTRVERLDGPPVLDVALVLTLGLVLVALGVVLAGTLEQAVAVARAWMTRSTGGAR